MTLETFLEKLEQTPRDWYETYGMIRRKTKHGTEQCPISACKGVGYKKYRSAAERLGLSEDLADEIAHRADEPPDPQFSTPSTLEFRAKLLKACGLEGA